MDAQSSVFKSKTKKIPFMVPSSNLFLNQFRLRLPITNSVITTSLPKWKNKKPTSKISKIYTSRRLLSIQITPDFLTTSTITQHYRILPLLSHSKNNSPASLYRLFIKGRLEQAVRLVKRGDLCLREKVGVFLEWDNMRAEMNIKKVLISGSYEHYKPISHSLL